MKEQAPSTWTRSRLARRAGVGAETLRFYEQKGLLPPPERNGSGYRIYDEKDLARLHFIRRSQELGFSLQDIKQLLQLTGSILTPRREVKSFAQARLDHIRGKIQALQAMEQALGALVDRCNGKGALHGCPIAEFLGSKNHPTGDPCHE